MNNIENIRKTNTKANSKVNSKETYAQLASLMLSMFFLVLQCNTAQAQTPVRFTFSTNGAEVTDAQTDLVWKRCSEGQSWSGSTCTGTATTHTHEQALALAKAQAGWRLPNIKELSSLTDTTRIFPAINVQAFPATPSAYFWSATPYASYAGYAWFLNFDNGAVSSDARDNVSHVRLVR